MKCGCQASFTFSDLQTMWVSRQLPCAVEVSGEWRRSCWMWGRAGRKVGKGLCSQHGAVEGGQGRSFLLDGVVMGMNSLERREQPQPAGAQSRVAHPRSSASFWCCPCWPWIRSVLSSHGAAQPVEQGLRGSRWTTGWEGAIPA